MKMSSLHSVNKSPICMNANVNKPGPIRIKSHFSFMEIS